MADPTARAYACKWFGCIRDAHATIRGDHEALEKLFAAAIEAAERAAAEREREEIARYVETHYPVHITGPGPSRWAMDADSDGGKVQREYAKAIRARGRKP